MKNSSLHPNDPTYLHPCHPRRSEGLSWQWAVLRRVITPQGASLTTNDEDGSSVVAATSNSLFSSLLVTAYLGLKVGLSIFLFRIRRGLFFRLPLIPANPRSRTWKTILPRTQSSNNKVCSTCVLPVVQKCVAAIVVVFYFFLVFPPSYI
ncbi:hypothetical protein EDB84DRAFT_498780 [Lactarius hengduanensis]|nr:hypothetical protein EDB84DRAFT_498780 [Lactarius hengduanensis]